MAFFALSGTELAREAMTQTGKSVAVFLNANPLEGGVRSGGDIEGDDLLLLFNAADQDVTFVLPTRDSRRHGSP